jgi:hypothetical protein
MVVMMMGVEVVVGLIGQVIDATVPSLLVRMTAGVENAEAVNTG